MVTTCFVRTLIRTLLTISVLLRGQSSAQEVPISALPPKMQQPIPDRVVYHMFLRHIAALEHQAQQAQANGQNPNPWRNHILHKFGLTAEEQQRITPIALEYEAQWRNIHEREQVVAKAYKARYFPNGTWPKGQPLPPRSSELIHLRDSSRNLTQQTMERVVANLGPVRFSTLNATVRSRIGIRSLAASMAQQSAQVKGGAK